MMMMMVLMMVTMRADGRDEGLRESKSYEERFDSEEQ